MRTQSYWSVLWQTITSPSYYIAILNRSFWFSLRFFLLSYVLITILMTIGFVVKDMPYYRKGVEDTITQIEQEYPQDLELRWTGEKLESNSTQPVEVPYPRYWPQPSFPQLLSYIAPVVKNTDDITQHIPKSTQSVVGETLLFTSIPDEGWYEAKLSEFPFLQQPVVLNRETLPQYLSEARAVTSEFFTWLPVIYPIFFFVAMMPFRLLSLFFETLVLFLLLSLISMRLPFKKIFQIALHVGVVAEIITVITHFYTIPDPSIFTISFWVYITIVLFHLRNIKEVKFQVQEQKKEK